MTSCNHPRPAVLMQFRIAAPTHFTASPFAHPPCNCHPTLTLPPPPTLPLHPTHPPRSIPACHCRPPTSMYDTRSRNSRSVHSEMSWKTSRTASGMMPGSSPVPFIVCVLPEEVCRRGRVWGGGGRGGPHRWAAGAKCWHRGDCSTVHYACTELLPTLPPAPSLPPPHLAVGKHSGVEARDHLADEPLGGGDVHILGGLPTVKHCVQLVGGVGDARLAGGLDLTDGGNGTRPRQVPAGCSRRRRGTSAAAARPATEGICSGQFPACC